MTGIRFHHPPNPRLPFMARMQDRWEREKVFLDALTVFLFDRRRIDEAEWATPVWPSRQFPRWFRGARNAKSKSG